MPSTVLSVAVTVAALLVLTNATDHSVLDARHWSELKTGTPLSWPALRFHFTVKTDAKKVYGQPAFDMYATPIVLDNNKNVIYDVYATFTEASTLHNYTLVNGVPYMESTPFSTGSSSAAPTPVTECMSSESDKLPAINPIVAAVNQATPVSKNESAATQCWTGSSYAATMDGSNYSVCITGTTGFTMQGSDMDVSVEYLESHIEVVAPTIAANATSQCSSVASSTSVTELGHALVTGGAVPSESSRKLRAALDLKLELDLTDSSCSCQSTPRPCVFIHGQGIQPELAENQDSFPHYWGNLTDHAPCCSSMKFARLDTIHNSWTSKRQQQKVCERILAVSDSSTRTRIADTIVVTHSMGNLMLAGALANGRCKLDSSSTWLGLAGPMKGSMASDFVQDSCAGKTSAVLEKFGEITGKCPPQGAIKSLAYEGESYSPKQLDAAYKAAQKAYRANVYALMCGEGYSGLLSTYQAKFWLLGPMIHHKSDKNDGMVEFQSCAAGIPESEFGDTYRDRFYRTKLNHFDMQFLAGDSLLNEAKMPVKWFECVL